MARTRVRVVGSGYTTFNYKGRPIAFLTSFGDGGQQPIGPRPFSAITPIGALRPVEIVTQRVLAAGTLTLTIAELWNEPIWWQLAGLEGTHTIGDVFDRLREEPSYVSCTKIIQPPGGVPPRGLQYHNCVVYGIDDGETVNAGDLEVAKNISIVYTHKSPL
jgi:hypothetical protein